MLTCGTGRVRTKPGMMLGVIAGAVWLLLGNGPVRDSAGELPYARMAERIVGALQPAPGERVLLRHDPALMPELLKETRLQLEAAGAKVEALPYGPAENFEERLAQTDIYVWLPTHDPAGSRPTDQLEALGRWLDEGGGRQIHFHWGDGTRAQDGSNGEHSAAYDRIYADALAIDYAALDRRMDTAIERLRSNLVWVTTPAGTQLMFVVRDRPFTKQNGDASQAAMESATVRIQREIELPAGALRVAPVERSVNGVMVLPQVRIGDTVARNVQLTFQRGQVQMVRAQEGQEAVERYLEANPALKHFREFALGLNPKLVTPPGGKWIPYYGYGAGVVRLALGDNSELGGAVTGGAVRWFFFPDATVRVGGEALVENGRLTLEPQPAR